MLWTICVILFILWLLGFISGYAMGGLIHILLVIAVIVLVVQLIQGRRAAIWTLPEKVRCFKEVAGRPRILRMARYLQ